ncbi:MAG TPA: carotenoid biosynthesis protein [Candidatus Methylacidiphilales bacterium]|nr:carotenoid biosynthesis protein [Candidatus Methylacidiphilales bacterium]
MKNWSRIEKIAFGAFLFWTAAALIFTLLRISPENVARWPVPGWLAGFVDLCLGTGDPILILLAFANTHFHAARQWTSTTARRWALIVCGVAFGVETAGAWSGFPFGSYHYTDRFGPLLGLVPFTIPLAWHVVVTNALFMVRAVGRYLSRKLEAVGAALICAAYDFVLEPFATRAKHYWEWSAGQPPAQNYAAWFAISALLVWFFAPSDATRFPADRRPLLILGLTLLIFVAGS